MRILSGIEKAAAKSLLIKRQHLNQHNRHHAALIRTMEQCQRLKEKSRNDIEAALLAAEQAGFQQGYSEFFASLQSFLLRYEELQTARMANLRQQLRTTLLNSLKSQSVATAIVNQLVAQCDKDKPLLIVVPQGVTPVSPDEQVTIVQSEDNGFSIEQGASVIHFPAEEQCQQWLSQAEPAPQDAQQRLRQLKLDLLADIIEKLRFQLAEGTPKRLLQDSYDDRN